MACIQANAADQTTIATSALEFGGSLGKLLWITSESKSNLSQSEADQFQHLAYEVQERIQTGRASSDLIKANFNVIGTALAYTAAADPEPLTKAVAGFSAWGANKTGDAIGNMVLESARQQAASVLAAGLKNSKITDQQWQQMSDKEIEDTVANLKIGGEKLRDILQDDPKSMAMLQAFGSDLATDVGLEAIRRTGSVKKDVVGLRRDLKEASENLQKYQSTVSDYLDDINSRLSGVREATLTANQKLDDLATAVQNNMAATKAIASISYSGWTTAQKLQAVQGGLIPNLSPEQRSALIESLQAEQVREYRIHSINAASQNLGKLGFIAGQIGLPKNVVDALQSAQIATTSIAQFATGDILGGIGSLTSLAGIGAPDAGAQRDAAMRKYLDSQFEKVNQKLDQIIDLQIKTLNAVTVLANQQQEFRKEIIGQLDRIENTVLRNEATLQATLLSKWTECHDMVSVLNGQYEIPTRSTLVDFIGTPNSSAYVGKCYNTMTGFLQAYVKSAQWDGQIIDATSFQATQITSDPALQKAWALYQAQRAATYRLARDFIIGELPPKNNPAVYLARFAQPVTNNKYQSALRNAMEKPNVRSALTNFHCNDKEVLAHALADLLCYTVVIGAAAPPKYDRLQDILSASLIGPLATWMVEAGMSLSTLADFGFRDEVNDTFTFVPAHDIESFASNDSSNIMRISLQQRKGSALLMKLQWLTESTVLQESVSYGDFTAELAEKRLYDSKTRSLNVADAATDPQKQAALSAMRYNPILARNVVMLAMRHAIADTVGGFEQAEKVKYSATYYGMALSKFSGQGSCTGDPSTTQLLQGLFPNWSFINVVTDELIAKNPNLSGCPKQTSDGITDSAQVPPPSPGFGIAVSLGSFYVTLPSAITLAEGGFEQSETLRQALRYRDRVSQRLIDRNLLDSLRKISETPEGQSPKLAFSLLNEAWGWQHRPKP